ncbi:MAG: PadR family transcriptional regulator [Clostridia bacterium]|nr:PadR family transcriptional regulator [Clostridia bacterium]
MRNIEDIQENLKRGVIDLVILTLLTQGDMYPYQINQEIEKRTSGNLKFYVGSMYGPLRRMLENGEISERRELAGKRRFRNYYHIEQAGYDYLSILQKEYQDMIKGMTMLIQSTEDNP